MQSTFNSSPYFADRTTDYDYLSTLLHYDSDNINII